MPALSGPYGTAAFFVLISALLHLFAIVYGGFSGLALIFIPIGLVYLGIAAGLARGWRWLAWISFFVMCIGGIAAISQLWSISPIPGWWFALIVAADWLVAAFLFAGLWRSAPQDMAS